MLKSEEQSGFQGFGDVPAAGGCHYVFNMIPTPYGLAPFYKNQTETTSGVLTSMELIRCFAEEAGVLWGMDDTGKIYSKASGSWALEHTTVVTTTGNGLILDQTGRMLAVHSRYLAKKDAPGSTSWTESFKDLGSTVAGDKVMDTFEDWVVIPHGSNVALLNTTDDSFNSAGLTFPSNCTCFIACSNHTGILLGVNMGNRSFVALWDAQSTRAITDWMWFDHPLKSICRAGDSQGNYQGNSQWIVTTTREIVITNGYTRQTLPSLPDPLIGQGVNNPIATGTMTMDEKLFVNHNDGGVNYGRRKSGLFILDLTSKLWRFVPPSDNALNQVSMGAIYSSSDSKIALSHYNVTTGMYFISTLTNAIPSTAHFITDQFGLTGTRKIAEGSKVEFLANDLVTTYVPMSFTVSVKIYDFTRPLWTAGRQNNSTASAANQLNVDTSSGSTNKAQVGDEVTVLNGTNAGLMRHITQITNPGTSNETWTLDIALPNPTEANMPLNIQPFKLVNRFVFQNVTNIPIDGLYFDVENRYKGKKYLLKVLFEGLTNAPLAVPSTIFIYDDKGIV